MTETELFVAFGLFYLGAFGTALSLGLELDRWLRRRAARRRFE